MNKDKAFAIATLFGSGYFPIAPGTIGSAVTMPFVFLVAFFLGFWGVLVASIFLFFFGVYVVHYATKGETEHDPSCIVIDEAMGIFVTFLPMASLLRWSANHEALSFYFWGFFLFRAFDAIKPQPARWADTSLNNAWGVMLDDLFAAIYSAIALYATYVFFYVL